MSKKTRHQRILDLVGKGTVASQEQLRELLEQDGFTVTQSTLSRDLKDLELVKGPHGYQFPGAGVEPDRSGRGLAAAIRQHLLKCTPAGHLVVLKTEAGDAQALALALDRAELDDVTGRIDQIRESLLATKG